MIVSIANIRDWYFSPSLNECVIFSAICNSSFWLMTAFIQMSENSQFTIAYISKKLVFIFFSSSELRWIICMFLLVITLGIIYMFHEFCYNFLTRDSYYTRNWHVFLRHFALTIFQLWVIKGINYNYHTILDLCLPYTFYILDCQCNNRNFTIFSSPIIS